MVDHTVSGFDFNDFNLFKYDPLYTRVLFDKPIRVIKLIKTGINLEVKDGHGRNALHYSCRGNMLEIIEELLEHGANVDAVDKANFTPLHMACYYNHIQAVKLLLEYNANDQIRNSDGKLPIELTNNEIIIELLTNYQHMSGVKEPAN